MTEIDFVDGDEASDKAAQNYQKRLSATVQNAAQNLSLQTIKDARVESVSRLGAPDMRSNPGPPMTLANMRLNGVRAVIATCANCGLSRMTRERA